MLYIISFVFWTIFGSFVSVLVHRIKKWKAWIVFWRSECPKCHHKLGILDLFPIFSYLFLNWKCRYCKNKISLIYPLLELSSAIVFVFLTHLVIWTWNLQIWAENIHIIIYARIVWVVILAIAFYDILFYEISFILSGILAALLFMPQFLWIIWNYKLWIVLGFFGFIWFLVIAKIRKVIKKIEWLGWWDAIWAALIWLWTPILIDLLNISHYPTWIIFYVLLLLWFMVWAIFWAIMLIINRKKNGRVLPFLPFMFVAIVLFSFIWKNILNLIVW